MLRIILLALFIQVITSDDWFGSGANPWTPQSRDQNWMKKHDYLVNQTKKHGKEEQIIFIGDSITEGWFWSEKSQNIWDKNYASRHGYNYGISGDKTENVIWRIRNKEFDGLTPKVIVLMIGTNNLVSNKLEDVAHGVQEVIKELKEKMPASKIILLGVLPRNDQANLHKLSKQINPMIQKLADGKVVHWLDMGSHYEVNGKLKTDLYIPDSLHLSAAGYEVWQKTMEPLLKQLLK